MRRSSARAPRSCCAWRATQWKPIAYRSRNAAAPISVAVRMRRRPASCSVRWTIVKSALIADTMRNDSSWPLVLAHDLEERRLERALVGRHRVEPRAGADERLGECG